MLKTNSDTSHTTYMHQKYYQYTRECALNKWIQYYINNFCVFWLARWIHQHMWYYIASAIVCYANIEWWYLCISFELTKYGVMVFMHFICNSDSILAERLWNARDNKVQRKATFMCCQRNPDSIRFVNNYCRWCYALNMAQYWKLSWYKHDQHHITSINVYVFYIMWISDKLITHTTTIMFYY